MDRGLRLTIGTIAALMLAGGPAAAQTPRPAALVLEVRGAPDPAVRPFREIPVGTTVTLPSDTKLVFMHYDTCQTFTVVGGKVSFTANREPSLTGGTSEAEAKGNCPRRMAASGMTSAGVFRSGSHSSEPTRMSTKPAFVLVGPRAEEVHALRILHEAQEVLNANLEEPWFEWPKDAAPLTPDRVYELVLLPTRSGAPLAKMRFKVVAPGSAAVDEALNLVTVE